MHKLVLQFNGANYEGWQRQSHTSKTIQGALEQALSKIFKSPVAVKGSGRTDSGVHAYSYIAIFTKPFDIPNESVVKAINSQIDKNIRVLSCTETEIKSPTSEAKSRTYHYYFSNQKINPPFLTDIMQNVTFDLDIDLMMKACKLFEGQHDFNRFHCTGSDPRSTIRNVFECKISIESNAMNGLIPPHYMVSIKGSGFLKQMVRLIVGAIWDVGRKKISLIELKEALDSPSSGGHISAVAPPNGLVKFLVEYD